MKEEKDKTMENLLTKTTKEEGEGCLNLPMVRSLETYFLERQRKRRGFLAWLFSDAQERIEERARLRRVDLKEKMQTTLCEIKARQVIEMAKIRKEKIVNVFQVETKKDLELEKQNIQAKYEIERYQAFYDWVDNVIHRNFTEAEKIKLVGIIYEKFYPNGLNLLEED